LIYRWILDGFKSDHDGDLMNIAEMTGWKNKGGVASAISHLKNAPIEEIVKATEKLATFPDSTPFRFAFGHGSLDILPSISLALGHIPNRVPSIMTCTSNESAGKAWQIGKSAHFIDKYA